MVGHPTFEGVTKPPLRILSHLPVDGVRRAVDGLSGVELIHVPMEGPIPESATGEVLLTFTEGAPNLGDVVARGVRWIHTIGTGVERFPFEHLGERTLTCARGVSAIPIAEWALAMMLAFEKNLPENWLREPPKQWNIVPLGALYGRTLGILGLGGIGVAVAQRALPFGMKVRAVRRTRAPSPLEAVEVVESLEELIPEVDHLVLASPVTDATRYCINREMLARVKPGLHLVNVSRGALVDLDALRPALEDGRVARASLDTVEPEPLPAGHWLYSHPRVALSAHISWCMPGALDAIVETFGANLRRYLAGEPLAGLVDRALGY